MWTENIIVLMCVSSAVENQHLVCRATVKDVDVVCIAVVVPVSGHDGHGAAEIIENVAIAQACVLDVHTCRDGQAGRHLEAPARAHAQALTRVAMGGSAWDTSASRHHRDAERALARGAALGPCAYAIDCCTVRWGSEQGIHCCCQGAELMERDRG